MKNYLIWFIIIAIVIIIGAGIFFILPDDNTNNTDSYVIQESGAIPNDVCINVGIKNNIIVIHKTGCPVCTQVLPFLEELENEMGLTFEYINVATPEVERLNQINIMPYYVPTVLIGCNAYVGYYTKEQYRGFIEEFKGLYRGV